MEHIDRSLALAGGGACGAYQAGSLLAFAEHLIKFNVVSGTSVGTLNGAYYVQGDGTVEEISKLCDLWREIAQIGIVQINPQILSPFIRQNQKTSLLDPNPLREVLDKYLNYPLICQSNKKLIITTIPSIDPVWDVLCGSFQRPVYFFAENLSGDELRNALFAATAIPFAFPSVSVEGTYYTDAGLGTPLPSTILYEMGSKAIISIFLSDKHMQNRLDYPNATVFQVRPSQNIFTKLLSMLDFSPANIEYLIDLGYRDTQNYINDVKKITKNFAQLSENKNSLDDLMDQLPIV